MVLSLIKKPIALEQSVAIAYCSLHHLRKMAPLFYYFIFLKEKEKENVL